MEREISKFLSKLRKKQRKKIRGFYQFYRVFRKDFTKELNQGFSGYKKRELVEKTASMGLMAWGILFLIIGYFAVRAALASNPSEMKDTGEAFAFMESSSFGALLLGLVALGAIEYGIFIFFTARYRSFSRSQERRDKSRVQ